MSDLTERIEYQYTTIEMLKDEINQKDEEIEGFKAFIREFGTYCELHSDKVYQKMQDIGEKHGVSV